LLWLYKCNALTRRLLHLLWELQWPICFRPQRATRHFSKCRISKFIKFFIVSVFLFPDLPLADKFISLVQHFIWLFCVFLILFHAITITKKEIPFMVLYVKRLLGVIHTREMVIFILQSVYNAMPVFIILCYGQFICFQIWEWIDCCGRKRGTGSCNVGIWFQVSFYLKV
jgi:hypothetical protein